jgi:hypothetical protein
MLLSAASDLLNCFVCKSRFDVPKMLPCGEFICTSCESKLHIKKQGAKEENSYKCTACGDAHVKLKNGLPVNMRLKKLLDSKPEDIYRGEAHKNCQDLLKKLKNSVDDLDQKYSNSKKVIKRHCDMLRNEVDVRTESEIALLNQYRDELVNEINDYELKCLANVSVTSEKFQSLKALIAESNANSSKWLDYIHSAKINDDEIAKINEEIESLILRFGQNDQNFEKFIFSNAKMTLEKNESKAVEKDHICTLIHSSVGVQRFNSNLVPFTVIPYTDFPTVKHEETKLLRDFIIMVDDKNLFKNKTDRKQMKNLVKKKSIQIQSLLHNYYECEYDWILKTYEKKISVVNDAIVLVLKSACKSVSLLYLFDNDLNFKQNLLIDQDVIVESDTTRLYVRHVATSITGVYDDQLKYLYNIPSSNNNNQQYQCGSRLTAIRSSRQSIQSYPDQSQVPVNFKVNQDHIFEQRGIWIDKISKQSGLVIRKCLGPTVDMLFEVTNKHIVSYQPYSNEITLYDFDGKRVDNVTLKHVKHISSISIHSQFGILVKDDEQQKYFVYNCVDI